MRSALWFRKTTLATPGVVGLEARSLGGTLLWGPEKRSQSPEPRQGLTGKQGRARLRSVQVSKAVGCRKDGGRSRMLLSSSDDRVNMNAFILCTWFSLRHVKLFNQLSLHRVNSIITKLIYVSEPFFPFPRNSLL